MRIIVRFKYKLSIKVERKHKNIVQQKSVKLNKV